MCNKNKALLVSRALFTLKDTIINRENVENYITDKNRENTINILTVKNIVLVEIEALESYIAESKEGTISIQYTSKKINNKL